ncbi:hypothetical protein C5L39_08210 [Corynebacterium alimapuense]|uniref:Secreted protein n=2 Tax=Corynebacterium alimapuense TaxID=1576874 RepID=A0A3M8K645_9CORY|nr:hypothetical protein C5L39_08210 [Corynebacterium alimapuense]
MAAAVAAAALSMSVLATPTAAASSIAPESSESSLPPSPVDELGRPTPETVERVEDLAAQPWMPEQASNAILSALAFSTGMGESESGVDLPEDGPGFTQFIWPTVSGNCIGGESDSVASAIAVPGPAEIPFPGAEAGQTTFLFTALGTAPAAAEQGGMYVHWFNLDSFEHGITSLENNNINPDGPATISGTGDTGNGTLVAVASGEVRTLDANCSFLPTAAIIDAR